MYFYGEKPQMDIPLISELNLRERQRLIEVRNVPQSTEPFRLFVKRNGVFIRSFESKESLDRFVETTSDRVFQVKVRSKKTS